MLPIVIGIFVLQSAVKNVVVVVVFYKPAEEIPKAGGRTNNYKNLAINSFSVWDLNK